MVSVNSSSTSTRATQETPVIGSQQTTSDKLSLLGKLSNKFRQTLNTVGNHINQITHPRPKPNATAMTKSMALALVTSMESKKPKTDTKILMSFAMANHGASFSNWLRDKLMKSYDIYNPEGVYVDTIVSRSRLTRHAEHFDMNDNARSMFGEPYANIQPDRRPHMLSETKAVPIGAMREDWNDLYKQGMSEAKVMIFVNTQEFAESKWCQQELEQFNAENLSREANGKPPLRGVFLDFVQDGSLSLPPHSVVINVTKTDGGMQGLTWDKDDFNIDDTQYKTLLNELGNLD